MNNSIFNGCGDCNKGGVSSQWSNVTSGGSTLDIFTPVANVAIGTTNPSSTRLYVSGNAYVSSNLTIGGNLKVLGDTYISNVLIGDLAVTGNLFASNVFGSLTGNIIGNSNVFGNLWSSGNIYAASYFVGDGSKLTGIVSSASVQWSNVTSGGSTLDIFTPVANVAIGTTNPNGTRLYVSGNTYISSNLTVGGNLKVLGDTSISNVLVGDLALTGNLFSSNIFGTHTGNIVGNSNVFGNMGLAFGDTSISNVLIGDLAVSGNIFASNIVATQFGPVNTSNIFGTHTGNIVGNSNVFGNMGLAFGDTSISNVLIGDLAVSGNLFASNVFGTLTGNIVGNSNVFGNMGLAFGDTSISNVLVGDLALTGNLFASNVFSSFTGNLIGNSNILGSLGVLGNVYTSNIYTSLTGNTIGNSNVFGNLWSSGNIYAASYFVGDGSKLINVTATSISNAWSNVSGSTDLYTPIANVAIGATNPSGTRLYVSGNSYISSKLTVGSSNVLGNMGLINGDTFVSNVLIGDLAVSGNIFASNVFGTLTGNIVGNSNVFGNMGLAFGDTSISNVLVGDLAVSGNIFASNIVGTQFGPVNTSNIFGTHTGNIVGNSNVFGNMGLAFGDTSISNVLIGDLAVSGNLFASNVFGTLTGNIVGNSNVFGNMGLAFGDTSISNVLVGDLALTGNLFASNVFSSFTGNLIGNSNILGSLGVLGNVYTSNIYTSLTGNTIGNSNVFGNLWSSGNIYAASYFVGDGSKLINVTATSISNAWSNVSGSTDLYTPIANVAIGATNPSGTRLYVSGNSYISSKLTVGSSNVLGNMGLINGDTFVSNVLIGDLAVSGNIFASNVFGTLTGNIVGNSNVFGNMGLAFGDTSISNVLVGDLTVSGNLAIGGSLSFFGIPTTVGGALSDETTTLTTSNKISIRAPFPFTIRPGTVPLFSLNQLPTVTTPCIFDIGVGASGTSIYSTRPQITSTSTSNVSANSGVPGILTGTISVPQYSIITANVFQVGSGTPTGAKFVIYCL